MAKQTLKQKKANPNSKYWKGKADEEWAKQIKSVGHCEICGSTTRQLHAHHIIARVRLRFRHDLSNGVCLCSHCHVFSPEHSPHLGLSSSDNFRQWFSQHRPGQFQWYEEHKDDKRKPDISYREAYENLTKE